MHADGAPIVRFGWEGSSAGSPDSAGSCFSAEWSSDDKMMTATAQVHFDPEKSFWVVSVAFNAELIYQGEAASKWEAMCDALAAANRAVRLRWHPAK